MATKKMDVVPLVGKQLQTDGRDLMRQMVQEFAERLMGTEADALCGAGYEQRTDEIGDCLFAAELASVAEQDPNFLTSAIEAIGVTEDGSVVYRVHLFRFLWVCYQG